MLSEDFFIFMMQKGLKSLMMIICMPDLKGWGYQGDASQKSIKKTMLYCTWMYILHMAIQCLGSKKGGFDEANYSLASGVLAFTQGVLAFTQGKSFNWSKLVLQVM